MSDLRSGVPVAAYVSRLTMTEAFARTIDQFIYGEGVEPAPCAYSKCGGVRLRKLGEVVTDRYLSVRLVRQICA
jgi:hypothetical protein